MSSNDFTAYSCEGTIANTQSSDPSLANMSSNDFTTYSCEGTIANTQSSDPSLLGSDPTIPADAAHQLSLPSNKSPLAGEANNHPSPFDSDDVTQYVTSWSWFEGMLATIQSTDQSFFIPSSGEALPTFGDDWLKDFDSHQAHRLSEPILFVPSSGEAAHLAADPFRMDSHPSEQSLIQRHLRPWVTSSCRHKADGSKFIYEDSPYTVKPYDLARDLKPVLADNGEIAYYFLTCLSKKDDQRARVKRSISGGGWWQAEKKEKAVFDKGADGLQQVGWTKNFTFMEKVHGRKVRPGWIMWELRLHPKVELQQGVPEIKIPVLCKVYPSPRKPSSDLLGTESDVSGCSTPMSDLSGCSTPRPSDGNMSFADELDLDEILYGARSYAPSPCNLLWETYEDLPSDPPQPNGLSEDDARDPDFFSIPRCVSVLNKMNVTMEEKAKAYSVFKTLENRQIFLSASSEAPEAAMIWLRSEIGNQL